MRFTSRFLCCAAFASLSAGACAADDYVESCEKSLPTLSGNKGLKVSGATKEAIEIPYLAEKQGADINDPKALIDNDAITSTVALLYVRARESMLDAPEANYADYNLVRVFSHPTVFSEYQKSIILSNPDSPGARLGKDGSRAVRIDGIALISKIVLPYGESGRRYRVKAHMEEQGAHATTAADKNITIEFKFTDLALTVADRCLNPLGLRVITYWAEDAESRAAALEHIPPKWMP